MLNTQDRLRPADMWEHTYLQAATNSLDKLVQKLNDLATDGWELVSTHSADRTIGLNAVTALVRRRIVPLPDPDVLAEGWYPDPSGRAESRYWNGRAWTFHVASDGKQDRDPPTALTPAPGFTE